MPLIATRGAASVQGFGEFAQVTAANYIEDVFSTYLYAGNASTQTITNNIDLSGKGGLVWIKIRNDTLKHVLFDTVRGDFEISSNSTAAQANNGRGFVSLSTGFSLNGGENVTNNTPNTYASWTFREQPKFFDVVTYTGTGSNTTIAHSLGSVPACIIVKRTDTTADWAVYHRSLANTQYLVLNTTAAVATGATWWNSTTPTSSVFSLGTDASVNASAGTYVAYIFAHNAGGFGLAGTDNVISCGTFTTDGSANADVTLGYEPQLVITKSTSLVDWYISDVMREMSVTNSRYLIPNTSGAEVSNGSGVWIPTATGLQIRGLGGGGDTHIYIAIRRGPMKVPTLGTSVFAPIIYTGDNSNPRTITTGIKTDLIIGGDRGNNAIGAGLTNDRLRGQALLNTTVTDAEAVNVAYPKFDLMTGYTNLATGGGFNATGFSYIRWAFQRAPSFFDEVCYTGTGSATTQAHNLGVVPELMIVKRRDSAENWGVLQTGIPTQATLNGTFSGDPPSATYFGNGTSYVAPTASVFSIGTNSAVNASSGTYVAYLFATCAGVSKVGSYAGTGATQTINCGFGAGGARFVLIKRTDSTGDWYVWDSARGMISGTDPSLLLNSTAAEVNANSVYAISTGFQIVSTAAGINSSASGANYIFLAIA